MKLPKPKKVSRTKLKRDTWNAFSRYIRVRDCLKTTGTTEAGKCFTCGFITEYRHLQAGHFIPGRKNAYLYDEEQVHGQCMKCNLWLKGNWVPYYQNMIAEFGKEKVEAMIAKKYEVKRYTEVDLISLKAQYDEKYKTVLEGRK